MVKRVNHKVNESIFYIYELYKVGNLYVQFYIYDEWFFFIKFIEGIPKLQYEFSLN